MNKHYWTPKKTNAALRALRAAKFHEEKSASGFIVRNAKGGEVFRALRTPRNYIVRHIDGLFHYEGECPVATDATR